MDYDLLVVGGGIQGAGVAQAAAARGYRVLVLEKTALAAGTSSRSSKLIHGGLRYLETAQFGLVRKSLQERQLLLDIAPELVRLKPFYFPVYAGASRSRALLRAGLSLYALLGGLRATVRFRQLRPAAWAELADLRREGLRGVFQYWDAQTDDAALTRAVMHSAQQLGAELRCPAELLAVEQQLAGLSVQFRDSRGDHSASCRCLVNAAGPWVNEILRRVRPPVTASPMELVQGSHILLADPARAGIYYVEAADRRVVFVMPWQGATLVGTTESLYQGAPEQAAPQPAEIDYLLGVYRRYFPQAPARLSGSFAGLRVLPRSSQSAFHRPRDTLIQASAARLITLYGGKLTSYRATAQQVLQAAQDWLPEARRAGDTRRILLTPVE